MTIDQIILLILSSSVIGGIIGAFIAGRFNLKVKDREYVNEYYELVLAKRIAAYESIQKLIYGLKTSVIDDDGMPYHIVFSTEKGLPTVHMLLYEISSNCLWLSDDLFKKTRDIGSFLFKSEINKYNAISFGKDNYIKLDLFREDIERLHIRDMLSLHEVKNFLKTKKVESGFRDIELHIGG